MGWIGVFLWRFSQQVQCVFFFFLSAPTSRDAILGGAFLLRQEVCEFVAIFKNCDAAQ